MDATRHRVLQVLCERSRDRGARRRARGPHNRPLRSSGAAHARHSVRRGTGAGAQTSHLSASGRWQPCRATPVGALLRTCGVAACVSGAARRRSEATPRGAAAGWVRRRSGMARRCGLSVARRRGCGSRRRMQRMRARAARGCTRAAKRTYTSGEDRDEADLQRQAARTAACATRRHARWRAEGECRAVRQVRQVAVARRARTRTASELGKPVATSLGAPRRSPDASRGC